MNNEELAKSLTDKIIETFDRTMKPVAWRVRYLNLNGRPTDWAYYNDQEDAVAVSSDDGEVEALYLSPLSPKSQGSANLE